MSATNITEINIAGFTVGWTHDADGQWYATAADEQKTMLGPFKQMGDARAALVRSTHLMSHTVGDGTYVLLTMQHLSPLHDDAVGSVTWMTADQSDGESVRWSVRDGIVDIKATSAVGTPRNAEAKGAAMLKAAQQAQAALASLDAGYKWANIQVTGPVKNEVTE